MDDAFQVIRKYHDATKHHFHRYARSAGYLDWANQPNPFRFYEGAPRVVLPLGGSGPQTPYRSLFEPPDAPHPINLASLSRFLRFALGLSAWKAAGTSRWSLRMNPSSGNLHPTEGYLVLPVLRDVAAGMYHYSPFWHALEQRTTFTAERWKPVMRHMGTGGFLAALTSIHWREAWKYGERAFRYCSLDAGHALAALALAARLNHWRILPLVDMADAQISMLLGLDRSPWPSGENEMPELLCWVCTDGSAARLPRSLPPEVIEILRPMALSGRANPLSTQAGDWPIIHKVAKAAEKPLTVNGAPPVPQRPSRFPAPPDLLAEAVLHRRRSGIDFDRQATLAPEKFFAILERSLPNGAAAPFEASPGPPLVNLLLFVHRVETIDPGLYLLGRAPETLDELRPLLKAEFEWQPAHPDLPLWRLWSGDLSFDAMELSCQQEIAAHGVFAVAMIVPFRSLLSREPFRYRHLFWECGLIGQILYVEAEAQGLRGTGIGCYFDDPVHELLGLPDNRFQCFYHFTVGYPIEDPRLTTLPGYHHLRQVSRQG